MARDLTARQEQWLAAIHEHYALTTRRLTMRELAARMGVSSPNGVARTLEVLAARGYLRRVPNRYGHHYVPACRTGPEG